MLEMKPGQEGGSPQENKGYGRRERKGRVLEF